MVPSKTRAAMTKNQEFVIVTAMKNEGPYILEWVAHHLAIGFGHFIVVTNDCADGTDEILLALQRQGLVTHVINPRVLSVEVGKWQIAALKIAQYYPAYRRAKWILHSDVDEFVHLEAPLTQVSDLVERLAPVDAISLTSTPYSGDNRVEMRDEPVCDQFTMMSRIPSQDEFTAIKTLYRNALPWSPRRNHRPIMRDFSALGLVWKDGSGNQLPPSFTDTDRKVIASGGTTDHARLNHYAIRSIESFLVKIDRGDVMDAARLENRFIDYYRGYDTSGMAAPAPLGPAARSVLDGFLKDPELARLHRRSFDWHRAKADEIVATGDGFTTARAIGLCDPERVNPTETAKAPVSPAGQLHSLSRNAERGETSALPKIASFWTGSDLTFVEVLVAQSYLDAGHEFTLYTLDEVGNVPKGVIIADARDIYAPKFAVGPELRHNNAVYSDIFRLFMIRETGAIWADMDAYCLRPFIFPTPYVFGFEEAKKSDHSLANGVLGLPSNSPGLHGCVEFLTSLTPIPPFFRRSRQDQLQDRKASGETWNVTEFSWGTTGPRMVDHYLAETGEKRFGVGKNVLYPGPRPFRRAHLDPAVSSEVYEHPETVSVHIFGKTKRFILEDFGGDLPKDCYLDRLCRRHGIDPAEFPIDAGKTTGTVAKGKVRSAAAE